jgi:hypothetical protein
MEAKQSSRSEHASLGHQSATVTNNESPPNVRRLRLTRVDEYETRGLANPDPFGAVLAAVQADLFRVSFDTEYAATRALVSHAGAPNLSMLEPAINQHLDVVRRIARNAALEIGTQYE